MPSNPRGAWGDTGTIGRWSRLILTVLFFSPRPQNLAYHIQFRAIGLPKVPKVPKVVALEKFSSAERDALD